MNWTEHIMEKSESRRHRIGGATVSVKNIYFFLNIILDITTILIQMYSSSGSKLLNIIIISCSLIVMNASSFLEYCGSLQESNGWPLWPRRDHWWRPLCRGQAGKACFHWRKSCGQGKKRNNLWCKLLLYTGIETE